MAQVQVSPVPRGHAPSHSPRLKGRVQTGMTNRSATSAPATSLSKSPSAPPPALVPMMAVVPEMSPGGSRLRPPREFATRLTPPNGKRYTGEGQRAQRRVNSSSVSGSTVDGHAESVLAAMRDFFQTRPIESLLDLFRSQDSDSSGTIDRREFKKALRKLNLDLKVSTQCVTGKKWLGDTCARLGYRGTSEWQRPQVNPSLHHHHPPSLSGCRTRIWMLFLALSTTTTQEFLSLESSLTTCGRTNSHAPASSGPRCARIRS